MGISRLIVCLITRPYAVLVLAVVLAALPIVLIQVLGEPAGTGNPELIAARRMEAGHTIDTRHDVYLLNGGNGPMSLKEVHGMVLSHAVAQGQLLKRSDFSMR